MSSHVSSVGNYDPFNQEYGNTDHLFRVAPVMKLGLPMHAQSPSRVSRLGPADQGVPHAAPDGHVLDHPVWASLRGPHSTFSQAGHTAARYPVAVSPLAALDPAGHRVSWDDLATLLGPEEIAVLVGQVDRPPENWTSARVVPCVQMVEVSVDRSPSGLPEADVLGPHDVPKMLDLVRQTRPGPFATRTIELGTYLGLRRGGELVAMAGQRLHPPGWTEISAVCTHPDYRGQGFASGLVRRLCGEIRRRGETPFLHAAASNLAAIEIYEALGFVVRREITFEALRPKEGTGR